MHLNPERRDCRAVYWARVFRGFRRQAIFVSFVSREPDASRVEGPFRASGAAMKVGLRPVT
jgi:hypothetical protein